MVPIIGNLFSANASEQSTSEQAAADASRKHAVVTTLEASKCGLCRQLAALLRDTLHTQWQAVRDARRSVVEQQVRF